MRENWTPFIKQVVDAELNASFHHPAQGTVVVVRGVMYEKWVVKSVVIN